MRAAVIVPTYNESKRLASTLESLIDAGYDVIVVDDGSHDKTRDIVEMYSVSLLEHVINRGQGAALRTGTEFATRHGYDYIAHFDADGQHRVEDLAKMIETITNEELDIVLGSRYLSKETKMPFLKRITLWFAKHFSKRILQLHFTDPQSGLRVFRADLNQRLDWQADDFMHATEILGLVAKNNLNYKEVPIKVNYFPQDGRKQVRPSVTMGWRMLLSKLLN
jgi:polyprenyl-phospho-N-acetylgalactosaminyl synthase